MRTMPASAVRLNSAPRMVRLASPSSALRSISALESNTIHNVSARLNTAAAVDAENGNDSFRLAPWRVSSTATLPSVLAARGRGGGGASLAGALSGMTAASRCGGGGAGVGAGSTAFAVSVEGAGDGGVSGAAICASGLVIALGIATGLSAGDGGAACAAAIVAGGAMSGFSGAAGAAAATLGAAASFAAAGGTVAGALISGAALCCGEVGAAGGAVCLSRVFLAPPTYCP